MRLSLKLQLIFTIVLLLNIPQAAAQTNEAIKQELISLNQRIDHAVVKKDVDFLRKRYAGDFVFTHGTGVVDTKKSWIEEVQKPQVHFVSREHDSTEVELHNEVAILTGRLLVSRQGENHIYKYGLRYVRVYVLRRKSWQLISHRTVREWHY